MWIMKNARAKRAKLLFFVVKYANLWRSRYRRRRPGNVNDNATNQWFDSLNEEK